MFTITRLLLALTVCLSGNLMAQTITWGTPFSTNALGGTRAFLSDGSPMPEGFIFKIGYWNAGYNPSADPTTWAANWNNFDPDNTVFRTPPGSPYYGILASQTNVNPALNGKQLFIWAYNDLDDIGTPLGESFLATSTNWRVLPADSPVAETYTTSTALQVLWGRLDPDTTSTAQALITGPGDVSVPKAANTFHIQTATWGTAAVPEPTTVYSLCWDRPLVSGGGGAVGRSADTMTEDAAGWPLG